MAGVFAFHLHLHLYLMAHPPDLPERMIEADPDLFFGHFLKAWCKVEAAIPAEARAAYLAAARSSGAIRAICADYRAEAFVDVDCDRKDRADVGTTVGRWWHSVLVSITRRRSAM